MHVAAENYDAWKRALARLIEEVMPLPPGLAPDARPIVVLSATEAASPAAARKGLGMALGDIIEDTANLPRERVAALDATLASEGLPSLTALRLRFRSKIDAILKRGKVRTEQQYHMLRNVADALADHEREQAWRMLGDFEMRAGHDG